MVAGDTVCLRYDGGAEAAAGFCVETFPDSAMGAVRPAPTDDPSGKAGDVPTVAFTVAFAAMMGMGKIDVAAIDAARRG